jgi:hypothetical protein
MLFLNALQGDTWCLGVKVDEAAGFKTLKQTDVSTRMREFSRQDDSLAQIIGQIW